MDASDIGSDGGGLHRPCAVAARWFLVRRGPDSLSAGPAAPTVGPGYGHGTRASGGDLRGMGEPPPSLSMHPSTMRFTSGRPATGTRQLFISVGQRAIRVHACLPLHLSRRGPIRDSGPPSQRRGMGRGLHRRCGPAAELCLRDGDQWGPIRAPPAGPSSGPRGTPAPGPRAAHLWGGCPPRRDGPCPGAFRGHGVVRRIPASTAPPAPPLPCLSLRDSSRAAGPRGRAPQRHGRPGGTAPRQAAAPRGVSLFVS
mmetsp:Transcript_8150/g.23160  ORF Transcript_8150/g.23160 Transcript_8150/m.23160 type:complete len:255 (+) Transcript_8150:938-1702(+)